jgi:hypothetical protein
MVTVLREAGMRFVIYTDDHEPHQYPRSPRDIKPGMKTQDLRAVLAIVQANKRLFIAKWESMHGGSCL